MLYSLVLPGDTCRQSTAQQRSGLHMEKAHLTGTTGEVWATTDGEERKSTRGERHYCKGVRTLPPYTHKQNEAER